ncbi:MAG TPA: hypothetical protein VI248_22950 [Kineosporiaceae bacterium]
MSLLLPALGIIAIGAALAAATLARVVRRHGHRCTEQTRPASCGQCAAVLRGEARGGHLVCACGAVSPHLVGSQLLAWAARHHGETLPPLPDGIAEPFPAGDEEPAGPAASTTRGRAAAEAEERVRQTLADALSETERRMIHRGRRKPDPITPQLLREAARLGIQPPHAPGPSRDRRTGADDEAGSPTAVEGDLDAPPR